MKVVELDSIARLIADGIEEALDEAAELLEAGVLGERVALKLMEAGLLPAIADDDGLAITVYATCTGPIAPERMEQMVRRAGYNVEKALGGPMNCEVRVLSNPGVESADGARGDAHE